MKQKKNFILSIMALLLFMRCSNNVPDTIYNNDTSDCNCDDNDVMCDPPPDLYFLPATPFSPLPITIPKTDEFPQYEDWDTIYASAHTWSGWDTNTFCGWDTNRMCTITSTSVDTSYINSIDLLGKNTDGTFRWYYIIASDTNFAATKFISQIKDYLGSAIMKKKYYVVKNEVSMDSSAYFYNFDYYKEKECFPITIPLRLVPK